jgi:hypothetical protein
MPDSVVQPLIIKGYLATGCSTDVVANYGALTGLANLLEGYRDKGLAGYRAAHLYTDDDFSKNCAYLALEVLAASAGKPALWVQLEFHRGELDVQPIEAVLQRYGLRLFEESADTGFWDGTWKPDGAP